MAADLRLFGMVFAAAGEQRLNLYYAPHHGVADAYDFHSLVWEYREGDAWFTRRSISAAEFEDGSVRARWVNGVHSFDPVLGHAVIRVAEADRPRPTPQLRLHYTWRRWDLLDNREVEKLQLCARPDSEYEDDGAQ
ncbi:MAG: hypothetical protein JWR07_5346 [Nevskia sp.]|nr:hypothetical protein [Nevskia sp.]